jgi:hypothetical protein
LVDDVAVDEFDWRHTVARSLPSRFHGERARRHNDALIRTARHCATRVTDMRRVDALIA